MTSKVDYNGGVSVGLPVSDIDASIAWYGEVLGFELVYKLDEMGWAEVATAAPGVTVGLSQVEKVEVGKGSAITFGVHDVAVARAAIEEKGVTFDGETQVIPGMVSLATFYDPDGHVLMLYQDLSS